MSEASPGFHSLIGEYIIKASEEYSKVSYSISDKGAIFLFPEGISAAERLSFIGRVSPLVREMLQKEGFKGLPHLSGIIQDYIHFDDVLGKVLIHRNPRCKRFVASFPGGKSLRLSIPPKYSFISAVKSLEMNRAYLLGVMTKGGLSPDFSGYGFGTGEESTSEESPTTPVKNALKQGADEKSVASSYNDPVLGEITVRVNRGAKRISIRIDRDGHVILTVPSKGKIKDGIKFIEAKRRWIEKTKGRMSGKKVLIPQEVLQSKRTLTDFILHNRGPLIKRAGYLSDVVGAVPSFVEVTFYRIKWGKCSSNRSIELNAATNLLPGYLRDSVILHELAHLTHMNHGEGFHDLLERYLQIYLSHMFSIYRKMFPESISSEDITEEMKDDWKQYNELALFHYRAKKSRALRPLQKVINDDMKKYAIK